MTETDDKIAELEAENEELRERLEDIESTLDGAVEDLEEEADGSLDISRRGALSALAAAGVIGVGATGAASAQSQGDPVPIGEYTTYDDDSFIVGLQNTNTGAGNSGRAVLGITDAPDGTAFVGSATDTSGNNTGLLGRTNSSNGKGLVGIVDSSVSSGGTAIRAAVGDSNNTDAVGIESQAKAVIHDDLEIDSGGDINILGGGNIQVTGTKHFAHPVDTASGEKKVRYTSVEAGRALTEVSDVAELEDGRAEIEVPEHFKMVTSEEESLTVQVTPYAKEEVKPQVVEQSLDRVVVEGFSDELGEYTFAYTIKGVREGYEDEEIIVDADE